MAFSLSPQKLEKIKKNYERLRRRKFLYEKDRLVEIFDKERIMNEIEKRLFSISLEPNDELLVCLTIEWNKRILKEKQWEKYNQKINSIREGWKDFSIISIIRRLDYDRKGYDFYLLIRPISRRGKVLRDVSIRKVKKLVNTFFIPKSIDYADFLQITLSKNPFVERACLLPGKIILNLTFQSKEMPYSQLKSELKKEYKDSITLKDMPLVFAYYNQTCDYVIRDIIERGLTVVCAVEKGESIVRRYDKHKNRLVVRNEDDLFNLVTGKEIQPAYSFIADINLLNQKYPNRIVFDFDPSPYSTYEELKDLIEEFFTFLCGKGFKPKLRWTGGKGFHIILETRYDKIPDSYIPFARSLKFDTLFERIGKEGLLYLSLADLIRCTILGFATERKRMGKGSRITLETNDPVQRMWNIFVDWTRSSKNTGMRSIGSIHQKTGGVCIPLKKVPENQNLESMIKCSVNPHLEVPKTIDPVYKTREIYLVGNNPYLLSEPYISPNENSMSLINEIFEEYGWVIEVYHKYPFKSSFYAKYIWP